VEITTPDLAVQEAVGERLQSRAVDVERLMGAIESGVRRAGALRQAILAVAYSGRLTGRSSDTDMVDGLVDQEPGQDVRARPGLNEVPIRDTRTEYR
jgi:type I restriction enzyme S subunit